MKLTKKQQEELYRMFAAMLSVGNTYTAEVSDGTYDNIITAILERYILLHYGLHANEDEMETLQDRMFDRYQASIHEQ